MKTRILVNVDHGETRVAVLEDGRLFDFLLERENRLVGNVYKGRVVNVLPGMDAAFVEIGLSRNAFIYVTDVSPEARTATSFRDVDAAHRYSSISEALQVGEEIMVQIARPPVGTKGARVTTRIALPGRYVILLSHSSRHVGVARRIDDEHERKRLQQISDRLRPLDHGLILRTEAEERSESELKRDVEAMTALWKGINEQFRLVPAPHELHRDLGLVGRVARDQLTEYVDELLIDSESDYARVIELLQKDAPHLANKVSLYAGDIPIFEQYELESEIAKALSKAIPLPHGGQVTVDETEALTSIDVDTGKYVGKTNLADTILRTNLEAVEEVARQLRLRDIGGIIVIDFIDMDRVRDRIRVMNELESEFKRDRMRTRIIHLSPLGLVEMTRRRRGASLRELLCQPCPYCTGRGHVRTAETVATDLRRKVRRIARRSDEPMLVLRSHPEVAALLVGPDGDLIRELEEECGKLLGIRVNPEGHIERNEISPRECEAEFLAGFQQLQGQEFSIDRSATTYPGDSFSFYVCGGQLVQLPEIADLTDKKISLKVTTVGRWFSRAEVA